MGHRERNSSAGNCGIICTVLASEVKTVVWLAGGPPHGRRLPSAERHRGRSLQRVEGHFRTASSATEKANRTHGFYRAGYWPGVEVSGYASRSPFYSTMKA